MLDCLAFIGSFIGPCIGPFIDPFIGPFTGPFTGPCIGPFIDPFIGPFIGPFTGPFIGPFIDPFIGPFTGPFIGPFIARYKAPRDKMVCVLNCCNVLQNLLADSRPDGHSNPPGADEFLPALILTVVRANPDRLLSNLSYVRTVGTKR